MGSVNKAIVLGRLGRDPELRYTPSGQAVASFTLATSETWNDREGKRQERTEWHRIVAWGKLAEICGQYLTKGRQVFVEGIMRPDPETGGPRIWTGNDGQARASFEVVAHTVRFLGGRGDQVGAGPPSDVEEPAGMMEADDIPF